MNEKSTPHTHLVILLHGIARTHRSMRVFEKPLRAAGFQVLNIDYPSRKYNLEALSHLIYEKVHSYGNQTHTTLHFVTHSMGGLVVRSLLSLHPLDNVGRIVMLGTPNQGSEVADWLRNNLLYKRFYGPAGQELTTFAKRFDIPSEVTYELGVIAGNKCFDPICYFILPKPHDGKVSIESTKYSKMKAHIILPVGHSFMMNHPQVIYEVVYFLQQGKFSTNLSS